jgi:hypothetical protein
MARCCDGFGNSATVDCRGVLLEVEHGDPGAGLGERERASPADSLSCTRDQCCLAGK